MEIRSVIILTKSRANIGIPSFILKMNWLTRWNAVWTLLAASILAFCPMGGLRAEIRVFLLDSVVETVELTAQAAEGSPLSQALAESTAVQPRNSISITADFRHLVLKGNSIRSADHWRAIQIPPDSEWLKEASESRTNNRFHTGFSDGYRWLALDLSAKDSVARELILEIGNAYLAEVQVIIQRPDRLDSFSIAGSTVPFNQRTIAYRLPVFPVSIHPGEDLTVMVRVKGDGRNRVIPLSLWDQDRWMQDRRYRLTFFTAFFAIMSTISILGLITSQVVSAPFLWPWLAFSASGTAQVAVYTGLAFQLVWPNWEYGQMAISPFLTNTTLFSGMMLLRVLYSTRNEYPSLDRALRGFCVILVAFMIVAWAMPVVGFGVRAVVYYLNELAFLAGAGLLIYAILLFIARQRKGEPVIMLIALAPQTLGMGLHAAQNLEWLPSGMRLIVLDWTGIITVTLLLTLILMRRLRLLMDEGFRVFSEAVSQRRQNTYALLQRESDVRKSIGQDIDERLGPLMSSVELGLATLHPPHTSLLQQLAEARAEIRGICDNRIPTNLTERGLVDALQEIIRPLEIAGTKVHCVYPRFRRLERLDLLYQLVLFRIAQGLLNNVYKHAHATQVDLSIQLEGGGVQLELRDNGVGFVPDQTGGGGRGLAIIRQRVQALGGTFSLQSQPGQGSHFQIKIPLRF
jgi:signal transduction histidine kinase